MIKSCYCRRKIRLMLKGMRSGKSIVKKGKEEGIKRKIDREGMENIYGMGIE